MIYLYIILDPLFLWMAEQQQLLYFSWGAGGAFVISKRIERTLPLLFAAQQRNRALVGNVSVFYLCVFYYPLFC